MFKLTTDDSEGKASEITGPDHRGTSKDLSPYMQRSPRLQETLPVLYLRGLSTGDFSEALQALLGPEIES